ncbi:hypothetical protein ATPR_1944 [Acetobacter tropicalis NBRC 101654]|uniref:Uncharacterized protein n=1 Tax=Acetobacter tropicalis NBRC 101654 TaxID=749388 RepID=F7VEZ6_9PROT|nr:hypothetical protein ATPR_1944 [Acetobacter tropicalis NBRC 101654]
MGQRYQQRPSSFPKDAQKAVSGSLTGRPPTALRKITRIVS